MTACTGIMGRRCTCGDWHYPADAAAKFLRCVNDPKRASLCDECTSPLTCCGMADEVDARIREWHLHRAARMGVCSHQVPEPEPTEVPSLLASRWFWIGGALSAAFSLSLGAYLAAKGWL